MTTIGFMIPVVYIVDPQQPSRGYLSDRRELGRLSRKGKKEKGKRKKGRKSIHHATAGQHGEPYEEPRMGRSLP
jgi:hypothetical protein